MPPREEPKQAVEKLRERIATLVKRSAEKLQEMEGIQGRIDQLSAKLAKAGDARGDRGPARVGASQRGCAA